MIFPYRDRLTLLSGGHGVCRYPTLIASLSAKGGLKDTLVDESNEYEPVVELTWHDDEQTIIISRLSGRMTWDLWDAAIPRIAAMAESVTHDVYHITVTTEDYIRPTGNAFPHFRRFFDALPSNLRTLYVVNNVGLERFLLVTFFRLNSDIARYRPHFVGTFDRALELIAKEKANRPPQDN